MGRPESKMFVSMPDAYPKLVWFFQMYFLEEGEVFGEDLFENGWMKEIHTDSGKLRATYRAGDTLELAGDPEVVGAALRFLGVRPLIQVLDTSA